jgi:hypothetical protein
MPGRRMVLGLAFIEPGKGRALSSMVGFWP